MGTGSVIRTRAPRAKGEDPARETWHERSSRLYEEYRRPARALVRRAFGSALGDAEIEDVYSSAWLGTLRALETRHKALSDDEIRSYLLTAVANHASKELRRRRRKPIAPLEAAGAVADHRASPEESAAARETSLVARDVLSSLPPRRRAVMLLRYGLELEPSEVCGAVEGLSPRAYRKEITRGVDELATKMKLVEAGQWCDEREPVLKAYAAGLADADQVRQAEQHLTHCRPCTDFVARLSGHLHDLGGAVAVPGALDSLDGHVSVVDRLSGVVDRARELVPGATSRTEVAEVATASTSVRGTGAAGAGVVAKLAGLGGAGKATLACMGGGVAATACIAAGVTPLSVGGSEREQAAPPPGERSLANGPDHRRSDALRAALPGPEREAGPAPAPAAEEPPPPQPAPRPEPEPAPAPVASSAPATEQEFGVAAAAAPAEPAPTSSGGGGGGGGGSAVQQEFGP